MCFCLCEISQVIWPTGLQLQTLRNVIVVGWGGGGASAIATSFFTLIPYQDKGHTGEMNVLAAQPKHSSESSEIFPTGQNSFRCYKTA